MTNLTERLTKTERDQSFANMKPKDASTLILVDRTGSKPKVLMGRRNPKLKFMGGKFVFPGGRVDIADRSMSAFGALDERTEQALMKNAGRVTPSRARTLVLTAIRETFEETGILIGTKEAGGPDKVPTGWEAFSEHGVHPSLEALHFVARAITPPRRPRRFDTRFFVATTDDIAHQVETLVNADSELVELKWMTVEEAAHEELPTITKVVLEELGSRVKQGFSRHLPVPFYKMRNKEFQRYDL